MNIVVVAGARPNFVKIAPVVRSLGKRGAVVRIVHTGQHYDGAMSDAFFEDLAIPEPDSNLGVGSGSHIWQIAEVMKRLELEMNSTRPDAVVVVGDVNSTVAATIAAVKMAVPVMHVEAGLRSFDRTMPEEINRILTDSISHWLFTSEPSGETNLRREGIAPERIHFVGNVMIDSLLEHRQRANELRFHEKLGLQDQNYVVLTVHRPSNVDSAERLESILTAVHSVSDRIKTVFVTHPRTSARLKEFGFVQNRKLNGFLAVEPLGYLAMLSLVSRARLVMTDSGGLQEETTALGVPCLTLRENTERPVTVEIGTNQLVGWQSDVILAAAEKLLETRTKSGAIPEKWDGHASDRIARILEHDLGPAEA